MSMTPDLPTSDLRWEEGGPASWSISPQSCCWRTWEHFHQPQPKLWAALSPPHGQTGFLGWEDHRSYCLDEETVALGGEGFMIPVLVGECPLTPGAPVSLDPPLVALLVLCVALKLGGRGEAFPSISPWWASFLAIFLPWRSILSSATLPCPLPSPLKPGSIARQHVKSLCRAPAASLWKQVSVVAGSVSGSGLSTRPSPAILIPWGCSEY